MFKVEICGVNTSKLPLLSEEEKSGLLAKMKQGDMEAREMYIKGNLRLVLSVIQRFWGSKENVDDLFQIGCIGLIKAIDNFKPEAFDVKFSTYAVPMILGECRRYLRDTNSSIRVSRSVRDIAYKAIYAREKLALELGREPCIDELARDMGVLSEELTQALEAVKSPVSLYDPVYTEGKDTLYVMDQISDKKNNEDSWVDDICLEQALKKLPERERTIINLRFFEGKTQMEVAEEISISQAQVSRLEKNALGHMRHFLT